MDFTGMATVYGLLCKDGRTIEHGAFDHQAGETVPIVWRHRHDKITNIVGHGVLSVSESPPGMRIEGTFNTSPEGKSAKELVHSGDVTYLSIWANQIIEHALQTGAMELQPRRSVLTGQIREVSLVRTGANPGAFIDDFIVHSDDPLDYDGYKVDGVEIFTDEKITPEIAHESSEPALTDPVETHTNRTIYDVIRTLSVPQANLFEYMIHVSGTGEEPQMEHSGEELNVGEVYDTLTDEQRNALFYIVGNIRHEAEEAEKAEELEHEGGTISDIIETLNPEQSKYLAASLAFAYGGEKQTLPNAKAIADSLNEEQKLAIAYLMAAAAEEDSEEDLQQGDINQMTNIFEEYELTEAEEGNVLRHEDISAVLMHAAERRAGTMREWFEKADIQIAHGITDIDFMFPDAKNVSPGGPEFYSRPMEWVEKVLNATKTRPFSRIKSWYADLTPDAARAKGYVTGDQKVEEVIAVLKRTTTPQTIYKLQKLDRDDILDITDFDVVVWLKAEMRLMLREELARAIFVGDGRSGASAEKILETNVRPMYNDDPVYTINYTHSMVGQESTLDLYTDDELIAFVDAIALQMKDYRGSGSPTFYCSPDVRARFMLIRDTQGRRLHPSLDALAAALGVKEVMEIPVMANLSTAGVVDPAGLPAGTYTIQNLGVIVNLNDYVIGMDRNGQTNFFDDFDLDYNKYTYLYETRLSGALIHPQSCIAINMVTAKTA